MSARKIDLSLPDRSTRSVAAGTTPLEVALAIGPGLAKAALAGRLDGDWVDLRAPLTHGGSFRIVTARDDDGGDVIRHSAEHVMADAVKRLWPAAQIDVGRSDHSEKFQYDFDIPARVGPEALERIEAEMRAIAEQDLPFERQTLSRDEARELFSSLGEQLKLSRLDDIPEGELITVFRHGAFVDLCRGPHVQRSSQIGAFKLTEIAGSYWRGDEQNKMLQRIYGVAFRSSKELDAHFERLEEARRRDHRRLGAELDLFQLHEWSPGSPFYLPKGLHLYNALVDYMRSVNRRYGFEEVMCPQIFSAELFKTSGHYQNFYDGMFWIPGQEDDDEMGLKPMNCPGHCMLFRSRKRSYRELPLRFAEFSRLHRNERSGTLHGLSRVRSMSQDDAHCYCEPERLGEEVDRILAMIVEVYRDLALSGVDVCVATRPEESMGAPEDWESAERLLWDAVERAGFACRWSPGEGAFYGPKIEFHFSDVLGRSWQLSTVQLDMAMPERFGLRYIGADGAEHQPAMIHKAVLGSLERFIAIYLEHTGGDFPLWLAPVQAAVLPIAERHEPYARELCEALVRAGLRAETDTRNETLGYRIRGAETQKIPYVLVAGDREQADSTVTVRRRHRKGQVTMGVDEFRKIAEEEVRTRGIS